jgi:hypothetical protein
VFEAAKLEELPYLEDTPINLKVHNMIDELRRLKFEYQQKIRIVNASKYF